MNNKGHQFLNPLAPSSMYPHKTKSQTIRETLDEAKGHGAGKIYWDDPKFDPNDPTVAITGYGTMKVTTIEQAVARNLEDLAKRVKSGDLEKIADYYLLDDNSGFNYLVKAYMDVIAEMSSSKVKRKLTIMKKNMQ